MNTRHSLIAVILIVFSVSCQDCDKNIVSPELADVIGIFSKIELANATFTAPERYSTNVSEDFSLTFKPATEQYDNSDLCTMNETIKLDQVAFNTLNEGGNGSTSTFSFFERVSDVVRADLSYHWDDELYKKGDSIQLDLLVLDFKDKENRLFSLRIPIPNDNIMPWQGTITDEADLEVATITVVR